MTDQLLHAAVLHSELVSIHGWDGQVGARQQIACIAHLQPVRHCLDTRAPFVRKAWCVDMVSVHVSAGCQCSTPMHTYLVVWQYSSVLFRLALNWW